MREEKGDIRNFNAISNTLSKVAHHNSSCIVLITQISCGDKGQDDTEVSILVLLSMETLREAVSKGEVNFSEQRNKTQIPVTLSCVLGVLGFLLPIMKGSQAMGNRSVEIFRVVAE